MMAKVEDAPAPGPAGLRDLRRDLFGAGAGGYWAVAVVAFLFASTGPVPIYSYCGRAGRAGAGRDGRNVDISAESKCNQTCLDGPRSKNVRPNGP